MKRFDVTIFKQALRAVSKTLEFHQHATTANTILIMLKPLRQEATISRQLLLEYGQRIKLKFVSGYELYWPLEFWRSTTAAGMHQCRKSYSQEINAFNLLLNEHEKEELWLVDGYGAFGCAHIKAGVCPFFGVLSACPTLDLSTARTSHTCDSHRTTKIGPGYVGK